MTSGKMMVNVIAKSRGQTRKLASCTARMMAATVLVPFLAACTSTLDLFGNDKVDRSISTGSIASTTSATVLSDDMTVRNAVSSADPGRSGAAALPWANASTGSAGVIENIREYRVAGTLCRSFSTTRHSYEGIARFSGEACMGPGGEWVMTRFSRQ